MLIFVICIFLIFVGFSMYIDKMCEGLGDIQLDTLTLYLNKANYIKNEQIDIIDFKCRKIMTKQGNVYSFDEIG